MKPDGGPAFPAVRHGMFPGMSLRDYFAAKAMSGLISCDCGVPENCLNGGTVFQYLSKISYQYADAMLDERNK